MSQLWVHAAHTVKYLPIEEIGRMQSANLSYFHGAEGTVDEWDHLYGKADAALDRDIANNGIKERLTVSPSHSTLIDGHNRYSSAKRLGLTHLPVLDDPHDPEFNW